MWRKKAPWPPPSPWCLSTSAACPRFSTSTARSCSSSWTRRREPSCLRARSSIRADRGCSRALRRVSIIIVGRVAAPHVTIAAADHALLERRPLQPVPTLAGLRVAVVHVALMDCVGARMAVRADEIVVGVDRSRLGGERGREQQGGCDDDALHGARLREPHPDDGWRPDARAFDALTRIHVGPCGCCWGRNRARPQFALGRAAAPAAGARVGYACRVPR